MDDPEDPEKQSQIKQQIMYYNWKSFFPVDEFSQMQDGQSESE